VVLEGRASIVTETGVFIETGDGRFWIAGRRCAACCMESDSLLVLGEARGSRVRCWEFRVRPSSDGLTLLRRWLVRQWGRRLRSPEASGLASALLAGERSALPDRVRRAFRGAGTSHILSVSGLHVSLIAGAVFLALRLAAGRRPWVVLPAIAAVSAYVLLTGARTPAVRSGFMASALMCSASAGLRFHPLVLWSCAVAFVLAACPGSAWDAGAQMSFTAVLALVLFSRKFPGRLGGLSAGLYSGACVTASLAPLSACTYGSFQISSPWATLMSMPFMVALFALGPAALLPWPLPGGAVRLVAGVWLVLLEKVSLPGVPFPGWAWLPWVMFLGVLLALSKRKGFLKRFR